MEEDVKFLVYNAIKTPDGTVLESKSRYDYKEYIDTVDGKIHMVGGGLQYCRRSTHSEVLSVYSNAPHETIRKVFSWGSYGKDGDEKLHYIKLINMNDDHLHAIISEEHCSPKFMPLFLNEQQYRELSLTNNIK